MDTLNKERERSVKTSTEASKGFLKDFGNNVDQALIAANIGNSVVSGLFMGLNYTHGSIERTLASGFAGGVSAIYLILKTRSMIRENQNLKKQVSDLQNNQKPEVNEQP